MTKRYLADTLTEYVETVVIDPLGAETPTQRAGRKAERETPGIVHYTVAALATVLAGMVLIGAGAVIGASDPDAVHDLLPSGSPSGERAEPEESAR